ncbi:hypothetical protein FB382_004338 [Nocardioides ginsengisegetis]|uniref:Uncharacterized protein n=1 Tax=Nocardioides ginsengisegetis TaxID=661491 RepID=A0A7W3PBS2_9ACTN|nr:hypothetical protein [Nocardioides ginsengisegetis]MBA8805993.1 hypothetical protein [Nocardioides ginsengisegetis]
MAITPVTVTFKLVDFLGFVPDIRRTKVLLDTNVDAGFLVDTTTGGSFRITDANVTIDSTGLASFTVLPSGATGLNPSAYQVRVRIDAANPVTRKRETIDLGWYTITAAADLKDLVATQYVPPTYLSTVTAELDAIRDDAQAAETGAVAARVGAEAARDAAVDISGIATPDALVETLVKNTGGAGPLTSAALQASTDARVADPTSPANQTIQGISLVNALVYGG